MLSDSFASVSSDEDDPGYPNTTTANAHAETHERTCEPEKLASIQLGGNKLSQSKLNFGATTSRSRSITPAPDVPW